MALLVSPEKLLSHLQAQQPSSTTNNPVPFLDPESNFTASFSTRFSFSINNVNPSSYGDGLAFFLSKDNRTLGSPGLVKDRFLAIEFDDNLDAYFNDPDDNHVGLDIESLNSIKTDNPILQEIDLKSGDMITAWTDYKNDLRVLKVFISKSGFKPEKPILSVDFDLSGYLKEAMYVGFSGSTEGSTELHLTENWASPTFGFLPVRPTSHRRHNVSDTSVTVASPNSAYPASGLRKVKCP